MSESKELQAIRRTTDNIVNGARQALLDKSVPGDAQKAYLEFAASVFTVGLAADKVESSFAQLERERTGLVPAAYFADKREVKAQADAIVREAYNDAAKSRDRLLTELAKAAAPKVPAEREALARQELQLALTSGPGSLLDRVNAVAKRNGEAAGALNSDYGQTLLETLAADNREITEAQTVARLAALATARDNGSALGDAIKAAEAVGAAVGAASTYYDLVAGDEDRTLFGEL